MTIDTEVDDFLEHFGVKGMKWGVRTNNALQRQASSTDKRTRQGKKVNSLAKESQRIQDAGGGLRGTQRVRKQMVKEGKLSKSDYIKGNVDFGARIAAAMLVGGLGGLAISKLVID